MNVFPIYARCLSKILLDYRMHSFRSANSAFKNLCSSKSITYKESLRLLSSTSIYRIEETESRVERRRKGRIARDPSIDRSIPIPVETSIRYLKSKAYAECYGNDPVWKHYRRNHKRSRPRDKTRNLCIRGDVVSTGNPCPICRDEYLVVDYTNLDLLKQFISTTSGEILSYSVTGVCQEQHEKLLIAYLKAKDLGLITFDVPFRKYNYSEYTENL